MMVSQSLLSLWHEFLLTGGVSVCLWFLCYPFRQLLNKLKEKSDMLDEVHDELITQRTNCLTTLQQTGKQQLAILEKICDTQAAMHLMQAEFMGRMGAAISNERVHGG